MNNYVNAEKFTTQAVNFQIDGVTLLSLEEYNYHRKHINPISNYWWLRSPGDYSDSAVYVSGEGNVSYMGNIVSLEFGVRPALKINLESSDFQIGDSFSLKGYTWTIVSKDYALCDTTICKKPFRKDWRAQDANDYEKSEVKEFLEDWYLKQISEH